MKGGELGKGLRIADCSDERKEAGAWRSGVAGV
jgi:hypothetical protein